MKDNSQGRQQGENNNEDYDDYNNADYNNNSSKDLRLFPRKDTKSLKGLPPEMPLAWEVARCRDMAIEIGTTSVGTGHYLWRDRSHLPKDMNYEPNQAHGQVKG